MHRSLLMARSIPVDAISYVSMYAHVTCTCSFARCILKTYIAVVSEQLLHIFSDLGTSSVIQISDK